MQLAQSTHDIFLMIRGSDRFSQSMTPWNSLGELDGWILVALKSNSNKRSELQGLTGKTPEPSGEQASSFSPVHDSDPSVVSPHNLKPSSPTFLHSASPAPDPFLTTLNDNIHDFSFVLLF